jgi:L-alanine-DL-glutamate epimerase-like enolase superfamily enzyme
MRIRSLTAYVVRLPLKRSFNHASATRQESDNVLVCCELSNCTTGWGEGVPRSYVTGETPDGCLAQLAATPTAQQLAAECGSWPDVIRICDSFKPAIDRDDPRGCYGNALKCAVELSILDAYGRCFGEPASAIAEHCREAAPLLTNIATVQYSVTIDSGSHGLRRKSVARRLYGFRQCKVKVGTVGDDDVARLQTIRRWIGPGVDLRVDANEAYRASTARNRIEPFIKCGISCIEQPVPHNEVEHCKELRRQLNVPIMLDESLASEKDAHSAIQNQTCDLFNIRLSKCGGFLNSLRLAAMAHSAGLKFQLGCHPGESGILSAAGRHWASRVKGTRYLEGSYDRHLFRTLLTNEDMTFGYAGCAPALTRPGLGITINPSVLQAVTIRGPVTHEL